MTGQLQDKVVIVTGAASGIGFGILRSCIAEGALVAGIDIAPEGKKRIEAVGGHAILGDVSDTNVFADAIKGIRADFGRIDGIVNNAGLTLVSDFLEADASEWDRLWQVNQRSVLLGSQIAARVMVADETPGAIVNIASNHARASDRGYEGYAGTKGAITAMTRAMAWSLGPFGIRANALCPGLTLTEAVASVAEDPQKADQFNTWHATGRVNSVDDIGRVAAYLLSNASAALTGAEIIADQGMTARLGALGF